MQPVILPGRLFMPFQSLINKNVDLADLHTADWLRHFKLVLSEQQLSFYRNQGFAWMVARMFPNADLKTLCAFTDLNTLLFLLDDLLDHTDPEEINPQMAKDPQAIQQLINTFLSVMDPYPQPTPNNPVFLALEELWGRIIRLSTPAWQENFRNSMRQIFNAAIWQHTNVQQGVRPSIRDYMDKRQYLGAANIATDTIAIADKIKLPMAMFKEPLIARITILCRNTVCWANDLFSLSKEIEHGDYHNLVVLLQYHKKLSRKQAIQQAIEIHDSQVKQFLQIKKKLAFYNPHTRKEIDRYVSGLENIMVANIDWSDYETSRYTYTYAEEIQKIAPRSHYLLYQ
ncbi:hypothetical protein HB364_14090 [Pseudoflavitalea sp. X16]|uniref:terpene synthase family protein n=1 Tax=Paraflavitalea devenefica TaxID=2716334 RepID=UPI00141F8887|nr:terpene synthase family protein [Paraflavitalea devenefica]NII26220.1 hypothetical protein [Paraflavitalea devenefica]